MPFGFAGDAGSRLLGLDVGNEVRDRLLHHPRAFHHLRQEHLARAEKVADDVHARHQRPLDHLDRLAAALLDVLPRFLGVLDDERGDALDQRVREPRLRRFRRATRESSVTCLPLRFVRLRERHQALGGVLAVRAPAIEDHVLHRSLQLRVELVVDTELAGVDDAHGHPGLDRVIQEHGVDRLAHRVVAAKRKLTFDTPPEILACGRCCLIQRVALMKSTA